ncbi:ferredoxin reductase-like C-terminal NADP-linked domain-containing protein [Roridomyces roridus]|uniref:NADH-cytochrome b5 reductase n=1 Tax=Roridomyces roridus TaxID=1738132 RepID=A0AAD7BUA7_9AGAR|nr:ferredoxin reductase-like C-terminal NADP-linked domain-containing protein [Roridomyces roridus]
MPNRDQFIFLFTLVAGFSSLVAVQHYLSAKLRAAGYDISKLILLGLPRKDAPGYHGDTMDFHAIDLPFLGTTDLAALASNPAFIVSSGVIVVATVLLTTLLTSGSRKTLDPKEWQEFPLVKKTQISPNTAIYRFSLPRPNDILGLPIGKHISVSAEINGKDIMRSYTPISNDEQKGSFDLLIKSYEKGNISRHFALLKLGNNIRVKGPKGAFDYTPGLAGGLGMICGGSGITPMYQIINAVLKNPADQTFLSLIYANVNEEDILLKKEIDALASAHPSQFKVYYVLNNPPAGWTGGVGFVTKDQIQTRLPASTGDAKILMCGPPPMLTAMKKHLDELKWPAPRTVSKLADKVFLF